MEEHLQFMTRAIQLAEDSVKSDQGGPFGAVIVKDGAVVSEGVNRVTSQNDPTAHAEIVAIRAASQKLGSFRLDGASIYISAEPCPMCLGALYWAGIKNVFYGASVVDVEKIGFIDAHIYREFKKEIPEREVKMIQLERDRSLRVLDLWINKTDRVNY